MTRCATILIALLSASSPATAQSWPAKPVRIVNTFAAGGTADILARMVADQLAATFKQQFFVETRAGATGLIGLRSVMSTEPDGYNLVLSTQSLLVTIPIMNPSPTKNPMKLEKKIPMRTFRQPSQSRASGPAVARAAPVRPATSQNTGSTGAAWGELRTMTTRKVTVMT